jgi:predicted ABC-type transport system involved in lysophospholipase L1 biosynthesis ATPase subunit
MIGAGAPLIDIDRISKHYGVPQPLRIDRLAVYATDRITLSGLDAGAAETLINLITGASVPDAGTVRVAGRDTRDIATDTEWLSSLDRFGIVTARAVLIGALTIADNLALPLTLSIDPMTPETRAAVEALADTVGLPRTRLTHKAATLTQEELFRVHLARALAPAPVLVLLERPTAHLADARLSERLGKTLDTASAAAGVGWLALSDDPAFAAAAGGARRTLDARGRLTGGGFWTNWIRRGG